MFNAKPKVSNKTKFKRKQEKILFYVKRIENFLSILYFVFLMNEKKIVQKKY